MEIMRKVSWKWNGWIFGNYGKNYGKWNDGKYKRKQWKDKENMEEMYVELWNDMENM